MRAMKFVLCFLLFAATAAAHADPGCELDARNKSNIAQPIIGSGEMDAQLEKQVRDGFNLLYGKLDAAGADHVLQLAQQEAQLKQNLCGEALATWGMAQAARNYKLQ